VGLAALTFDKKGRLQLPAAWKTQTVTFQTTVNFRPLRCVPLLSGQSKSSFFRTQNASLYSWTKLHNSFSSSACDGYYSLETLDTQDTVWDNARFLVPCCQGIHLLHVKHHLASTKQH